MKTIEDRAAVELLVNTFYTTVRKDKVLGPIFNKHISDAAWPAHLDTLADFWETNLFGVPKFKGNPTLKHLNVDKAMEHQMTQEHFGIWLQHWFATIDQLFEGKLATKAKEAARRMAHGQFLTVWTHRNNTEGDERV